MIKRKLLIIVLFLPVLLSSQNFDIDLLRKINLNRNKNLDGVFKGITNSTAPVAIGVPVILFGYGLLKKDSVTKYNGMYIGASVIVASGTSYLLKYIVNRPRPYVTYPDIENVTSEGSPSFPSNHTSAAFAMATSVSIVYPKWYIIAPSYIWAGAVGYSRMDLGVHYPSDVLMGALIGAGSAYLCYKGQQWLYKKKH
jgi:membrane-associated phospholipid phosphatase